MTVRNIENDGFVINGEIETVIEGTSLESMAKSAGLAIIEITTYLSRIKPDVLLVVGDRYDMLPAVITASYLNIPIAHIQGGEKTGSIDEAIRHAVTKFAHLHFPATEKGKDFIIQMNEKTNRVYVTGCPSIDLILKIKKINKRKLITMPPLPSTTGGKSPAADKDYLLLIQHPVTTEAEDSYRQMTETLKAVHQLNIQTILIFPNLDAGSDNMITAIRRFLNAHHTSSIFCYKHIPIDIYINLLRNASCIIGNSSSGIRESCYFGTPCVNVGTRQKDREQGRNVINIGHSHEKIYEAIIKQLKLKRYPIEHIYGEGKAGEKIADIIYTNNIEIQK